MCIYVHSRNNMSTRPAFLSDSFMPDLFKAVATTVSSSKSLPRVEDQAYLQAFPCFQPAISAVRNHAKGLLERLLRFVKSQGGNLGYDAVVEASDDCLDNVALGLEAKSTQSQMKKLLSQQVLKFDFPFLSVDNSRLPFKPKISRKPNALVPLDTRNWSKHPYSQEIRALQEPQPRTPAPTTPLSLAQTPFLMVTTIEELQVLLPQLKQCTELAIDLEHHSLRSYQGMTCLMQLSTRTTDVLVDPLTLWPYMSLFLDIFTDPNIVKVLHGADSDVVWLQRDFGLYIVNLFDTGQAARELQLPSCGLAALLKRFCQVSTDKSYQLADWRVRPLTAPMVQYARIDTHYLLHLYDLLRQDLISQSLKLHKDPKVLLSNVFHRSRDISLKVYLKSDYTYMGIRRTSVLGEQSRHVLEELARWRDSLARQLDESPSFILCGEALLGVAASLPETTQELMGMVRRPSPLLTLERAQEMVGIIRKWQRKSVSASPARQPEPVKQRNSQGFLVTALLQQTAIITVTVLPSSIDPFRALFPTQPVKPHPLRFPSLLHPTVKCAVTDMLTESLDEEDLPAAPLSIVQPSTAEFIQLPAMVCGKTVPLKRKAAPAPLPDVIKVNRETYTECDLTKRRHIA